jgi:hypothetical protein
MVSVRANDGVVELTGVVPSFYLRQLAIACARRVAGVRAVIDQIYVEDARHPRRSPLANHRSRFDCANTAGA